MSLDGSAIESLNVFVKEYLSNLFSRASDRLQYPELLIELETIYRQHSLYKISNATWLQPISDASADSIMFAIPLIQEHLKTLPEKTERHEYETLYLNDSSFKTFVDTLLDALALETEKRTEQSSKDELAKTSSASQTDRINANLNTTNKEIRDFLDTISERAIAAQTTARDAHSIADETKHTAGVAKEAADAAKKVADNAKRTANAANKTADIAKKSANTAKKTANDLLPNLLTVLGILIAIVVAVVACYLNIVLASHNTSNSFFDQFYNLFSAESSIPSFISLIQTVFVGHLTLNVISLMLFLLSKITGRSIGCYCRKGKSADCNSCPETRKCVWIGVVFNRYQYVAWMNVGFLVIYGVIIFFAFK